MEVDFEALRTTPMELDGLVKDWSACTKWNPANGGLNYLKVVAGKSMVQVMLSRDGMSFFGDIRSHERASMKFQEFIDLLEDASIAAYLAQVPIFVRDTVEAPALSPLLADISVPECLDKDAVTNINFWMSSSASRSSIHYDPYHNILCVVAGRKQVSLWPPSAAPYLYPLPLYGEASNHSAVNFDQPDLARFPNFKEASKYCQTMVLNTGDALFIPEGWFHQVDSDAVTIAVNFWWPSKVLSAFGSQMDGYYFRRILSSLLDAEKDSILGTKAKYKTATMLDELKDPSLESLTPVEASLLQALVSLVSHLLENDRDAEVRDKIFRVLLQCELSSLRRILMIMVEKFPRTLEALILHGMKPSAAELLTRRFEEMDDSFSEVSQSEFYKQFYSVFDDPQIGMTALLDGKETFAASALNNVLQKFLGICISDNDPVKTT